MSNARFSIIPAWIVTDPRLKGIDLKVLCLLGSFTNAEGWCRRSQVKMADELGCGRSTVQASLNRLYEIGVVEKRIVESRDGRDSAHYYRVIHDRDVSSDAIAAWQAAATEEYDPKSEGNPDAPPATILAGGATPEMAPPATSGPAPINDTSLTNNLNDGERAPARGNLGDEEENPKAIETAFKRFFLSWKTAIHDSEPDARREWGALSPDERASALAHSESYQAVALSTGRKYLCSAAKYLKERRWVKLAEQSVQSPQTETTEMFSVFSRAGRALLMMKLFLPVRALSLTPIEQHIVDNKPEKKDLIWREKKEKQGWPEAVQLIERKRFTVTNRIIEISKDFERVAVNGPVWEAWKRAYAERCWPWPLAPERLEFAQFPPIPADVNDLDEAVSIAIENFQSRLNEGRNDDAA